tara:strand:- start:68 stop:487 length:420 start_codon:yes stop_codon:yes gene_type:complete
MNNNNNNITLMSDIDPSLYTNLKTKQQMFIRCIAESIGSMTTVEFSRKDLKEIANDHGIAWAPAWIVKDQKRMVKRGIYSVPELASYRNAIHEDALESDHVTIVEDVPAADDMLDVVAECCDDAVDVLKDTTLGRAMTA